MVNKYQRQVNEELVGERAVQSASKAACDARGPEKEDTPWGPPKDKLHFLNLKNKNKNKNLRDGCLEGLPHVECTRKNCLRGG